MPPFPAMSKRDSKDFRSNTLAICMLVLAMVVMLITVGLLLFLRFRRNRSRQVDPNSFSASRIALNSRNTHTPGPGQTTFSTAAPSRDASVSQEVAIEEGRREIVEEVAVRQENAVWEQQSSAVAERVKKEIMYPQGGIGETPSVSTNKHTPTSSKERVLLNQGPNASSPPSQDVIHLNKRKKPKLTAIITELPLTNNMRKTPQSNTPQEAAPIVNTKPLSSDDAHSSRLPRNESSVGFQVGMPSRPVLETMRKPNESTMRTPLSIIDRETSVIGSISPEVSHEGPVQSRVRPPSPLQGTSTTRKGYTLPTASEGSDENRLVQTRRPEERSADRGHASPQPEAQEAEGDTNQDRKGMYLSANPDGSPDRRTSTNAESHSQAARRHLSLGGQSVIHPPPPYTPEDTGSDLPPLPIKHASQVATTSSLHVTNASTSGLPGDMKVPGKRSTDPRLLGASDDLEDIQCPSPAYEEGDHQPRRRIAHHQSLQRARAVQSRPRSNSAPEDSSVQVLTSSEPSVPLPTRSDYFTQRP